MQAYQGFVRGLLPGNCALTKSMELTRINSSGTLWYTKKFLVLYYYVFLSPDIATRAYIGGVRQAFDSYIQSLPAALQGRAERFFYPGTPAIDLRSAAFKTFASFADRTEFDDLAQKEAYLQAARRCYFSLLMDSGGQTGVKKRLKQALGAPDFHYSAEAVAGVLHEAALAQAVQDCAQAGRIQDNSVKYLLSADALRQLQALAGQRDVTIDDARRLDAAAPHPAPQYRAIERDMVAFLRNERQVLYYYGYFHSRSSGLRDAEFSSLTPVGELALRANALEFLALWEHQKLKMVSQPPTVDFGRRPRCSAEQAQGFSIDPSPYLAVLGCLCRHGGMTTEQYRYVVSRRTWAIPAQDWPAVEQQAFDHLEQIKAAVRAFEGDGGSHDARKELLKYLLGIRGDLPLDAGAHPLGACAVQGPGAVCRDAPRLELLYGTYQKLDAYRLARFGTLFARCAQDLRRRYAAAAAGRSLPVDGQCKIEWDLYLIRPDPAILLPVLTLCAALAADVVCAPERMDAAQRARTAQSLEENGGGLLRRMGVRTPARLVEQVAAALQSGDFSLWAPAAPDPAPVLALYRAQSADDLKRQLARLSDTAAVPQAGPRRRCAQLVSCLKAYYLARFADGGTLRCECCNEPCFTTAAGEPYMEFHHLIPFGEADGPDHYLNLFGLCPVCHRKLHYADAGQRQALYRALDGGNYLQMPFVRRLRELRDQRLLRSYHLEYLLARSAISLQEYDEIAG